MADTGTAEREQPHPDLHGTGLEMGRDLAGLRHPVLHENGWPVRVAADIGVDAAAVAEGHVTQLHACTVTLSVTARHASPAQQADQLPQRPKPTPAESAEAEAQDHDSSPTGLPTRKPGTSYTAPDVTERSVDTSTRDPEEIKSAFSSFQLGMTVGRDSNKEEVHHE